MLIYWLISLMPAIGWGLMPIISKKVGGTPRQQLFGSTVIALLISLVLELTYKIDYHYFDFLIAMLSGAFWAIGQLLLFAALQRVNVSKVIPISNGSQLIFTTLFSGFFLGEWSTIYDALISLLMLVIMILAIICLTRQDPLNRHESVLPISTVVLILFSSLFITAYVSVGSVFGISGLRILFPQSLGMFLTALLIVTTEKKSSLFDKHILKNFITGISWALANVALFYSSAKIGVGLSFSISQMCIFISVLGGIVFLHERKTKKEITKITIGMLLFLFAILILSI
ncbi:MAG: GRP family sugar transporter [Sporolactobacillus sp.]|jgi:glucose uptake protein|nr:GRP family sugar transporter [Sporolactobacillus sp.]